MDLLKRRPLNACCFPRTPRDRITFLIFLGGGPFLIWYELFHVRPRIDHDPDLLWHHLVATAFIFVGVYTNLYKMVSTDISTGFLSKRDVGDKSKPGDRYCDICKRRTPVRTHHCKLCNVCILKRDHHCWFAGYCVGYGNQRYYVMAIAYCWIAGFYAQAYYIEFVKAVLGSSLWQLGSLLAPHVPFMLGYYTAYEFVIAALTSIGIFLQIVLTWLLQIQLVQIVGGQTRHERAKNITKYNLGLVANVREVFGDRWYLVWLSAFIPSRLPGDGVHFVEAEKTKIK
ncbi:putative palmitoyltransferase ZDHHC24 isoform X2 [Tubulanus polymorphus]